MARGKGGQLWRGAAPLPPPVCLGLGVHAPPQQLALVVLVQHCVHPAGPGGLLAQAVQLLPAEAATPGSLTLMGEGQGEGAWREGAEEAQAVNS